MRRKDNSNKPKWKKITTGTLYPFAGQRQRRVRHKETIRATEEELEKFIDQFELVENVEGKDKVEKTNLEKEVIETPGGDGYSVVSAGAGWYDVESSAGKVMNEKKLREGDAKTLLAKLEEETPTE